MRSTTEPYLSRGKDGGSQISFPVGNENPSIIRPQLLPMSRTSSLREPHPFPAGNREGAISHFQLEMTVRISEWLGSRQFGKCVCQQKAASRHINGLAETGKWFPRVQKSDDLNRRLLTQTGLSTYEVLRITYLEKGYSINYINYFPSWLP